MCQQALSTLTAQVVTMHMRNVKSCKWTIIAMLATLHSCVASMTINLFATLAHT